MFVSSEWKWKSGEIPDFPMMFTSDLGDSYMIYYSVVTIQEHLFVLGGTIVGM